MQKWTVQLSPRAYKQLKKLPAVFQDLVIEIFYIGHRKDAYGLLKLAVDNRKNIINMFPTWEDMKKMAPTCFPYFEPSTSSSSSSSSSSLSKVKEEKPKDTQYSSYEIERQKKEIERRKKEAEELASIEAEKVKKKDTGEKQHKSKKRKNSKG